LFKIAGIIMMSDMWSEKYRPSTIDDYVFKDNDQRTQVEKWISDGATPFHLLFSGPSGTGKTSLAKMLIKEFAIQKGDTKEYNASDKRGLDFVRDKIIGFCQTYSLSGGLKYVVLDESDQITPDAQSAFHNVLEKYKHVRFIWTANHPEKLDKALHSRLQTFQFDALDSTKFNERLEYILNQEQVAFESDVLQEYVDESYPDMRKCIGMLQQHSSDGELKSSKNTVVQSGLFLDPVRKELIEKNFKNLNQIVGVKPRIIIYGPPGIGKSHDVERELKNKVQIVTKRKGRCSALFLYQKLWETRTPDRTLVLDDCDGLLGDRDGIDLLKAATDTHTPRLVQWGTNNTQLTKNGIPKEFEYEGQLIFITNTDLHDPKPKSRNTDYMTLLDRCEFRDMGVYTLEDKLLRCQSVLEGGMLADKLSLNDRGMLFEYLCLYAPYFRNITLRTFERMAENLELFRSNWESQSTSLMEDPPAEAHDKFTPTGKGKIGLPRSDMPLSIQDQQHNELVFKVMEHEGMDSVQWAKYIKSLYKDDTSSFMTENHNQNELADYVIANMETLDLSDEALKQMFVIYHQNKNWKENIRITFTNLSIDYNG